MGQWWSGWSPNGLRVGGLDRMTAVFVCGPMAWPPMLDLVGGEEGLSQQAAPAVASGLSLDFRDTGWLPAPAEARDQVEGLLFDAVDKPALNRLRRFAEVMGWREVTREADAGGGPVEALTFIDPAARTDEKRAWHAGTWRAECGPVALVAAEEILGRLGRGSPSVPDGFAHMVFARAASRLVAAKAAPARVRCEMSADKVVCHARRDVHAGFFVTREYELTHAGFDGTSSPRVTRELFVSTDAALVLPYDPVRDRVLLVEQFRMGPYGRGDPLPWVLEPVAGRLDAGEGPEETAHRECLEEAGLALHGLEHISSHYCTPGSSTEFFHCYLGLCDLPEMRRGLGGLETENEDIRTHVLSFDDAIRLCATGEANVGPLVLMLLWLERERNRLRASA